ncbi:ABC transporter ATP-binding protein [Specibacter cremeus]|uniref:ABC transporter ATP-binding protein n=1 Tax=Specibacter cremeus TaxID=1629051 RepID=UPI000F77CF81|nr:ABC transporter ATP-binding protein [Specibacter cremeus]
MLAAAQLHVKGRHHTLLPPTTLEAHRGEVLLVQADGQHRRTALALALTGRMRPTSGTVALGHDDTLGALRRHSAIVDSPEVNEPENHLSVRSLVAEDLALVPRKFRDRTRPTAWLVKHGHTGLVSKWVEELEPATLLGLQLELALANRDVELVVVDSPDRHGADDSPWLALLHDAAAGRLARTPGTEPRELTVVAVVGRVPPGWDGPTAVVGHEPEWEPGREPDPAPEPEPTTPADPSTEPQVTK